jgi:hypothetical protein
MTDKSIVPLSKERAAQLHASWLNNHNQILTQTKMLRVDCGNILLEIKNSLKHREWTPKLKQLCREADIGMSTAQAYMNEAKLDKQLMPDDRKAIVAEGVQLSKRVNLENAVGARETNPDAPPEQIARIVKEMVAPHGGGSRTSATSTAVTPLRPSDGGIRTLTLHQGQAREPRSNKPATEASIKDAALAAYCIQLVDVILGRDEWMGKPVSEKWGAALKLAEEIDTKIPKSYRTPKMPASTSTHYNAENVPQSRGQAG